MVEARKKDKHAYLSYDKLIVDGDVFVMGDEGLRKLTESRSSARRGSPQRRSPGTRRQAPPGPRRTGFEGRQGASVAE